MSDLYEIATVPQHARGCRHTGYTLVWIDDQGHVSTRVVAMSAPARMCNDRACPHPLYALEHRFVQLRTIPTAWRAWTHLQPKELLF